MLRQFSPKQQVKILIVLFLQSNSRSCCRNLTPGDYLILIGICIWSIVSILLEQFKTYY